MERSAIRDFFGDRPGFRFAPSGLQRSQAEARFAAGVRAQFGTARFAIAGPFAFTVTPRSRLNAAFSALSSLSFGGT
jgi:hypothetical protein